MKIDRVSEHIWSLRVWGVVEEDGVTLVDAGLAAMAGGILGFIDRLQGGPLLRIALTHGHSDHVGAVGRILRPWQVPVYVHRTDWAACP